MVLAAATQAYSAAVASGPFRLLVAGGSQGARVMADVVPPAVERMTPDLRARLRIVQQARGEDEKRVAQAYARLGVDAEVAPFFADLPARIAAAHLIVSRSGASTVAELAAIGRPSILVPLPHALRQDDFSPERLANEISCLAADPERLPAMASAARSAGVLDAADRLADLVLRVANVIPAPR
jgi:UDP-N-acetylglucosamine--N-acetylmuramyl-(pentapeptide) pyrophosphoryl-undecaprenol N-acetylglucosamine transferase